MDIDIKAEIKKQEAELATLLGVLKKLNTQRQTVANDILKCQGAIENLKALEVSKVKEN